MSAYKVILLARHLNQILPKYRLERCTAIRQRHNSRIQIAAIAKRSESFQIKFQFNSLDLSIIHLQGYFVVTFVYWRHRNCIIANLNYIHQTFLSLFKWMYL